MRDGQGATSRQSSYMTKQTRLSPSGLQNKASTKLSDPIRNETLYAPRDEISQD